MITSTSTPFFGPDFAKDLLGLLFGAIEESTKMAYRMLWNVLMAFLREHGALTIGTLFILFFIVSIKAMMGRWGALGSFLYNLFYFGTLFVIGLAWGPDVFADDVFNLACAVILYPICYIAVGTILDNTGIRKFQ